tara:strand:+ start:404 stop:643 length:240 start_codon:yes stop_codon:yes gene_type:complete
MTDGAENYSKEAREYLRKMTIGITSMMEATREFNSKVDFISDASSETSRQMADIGEEIVSLGRKIIDFRKLLLQQEEGA